MTATAFAAQEQGKVTVYSGVGHRFRKVANVDLLCSLRPDFYDWRRHRMRTEPH